MNFEKNKDLTSLTTFGIKAKAKLFASYSSFEELLKISRTREFLDNEVLHIGGGSNLLFLHDYDGLVLHSEIKDIIDYKKDNDTYFVIAGAGVKWTDFVDWCLEHSFAGVENLAGIPGEVGAAPVQNVGAYGVEAKDVIFSVECFDTVSRSRRKFTNEQCRFGYRDSFFKHEGKGRYYVLRVAFSLRKSDRPESLHYGTLSSLPEKLGHYPSIKEVAEEVINIRSSKLPDPAIIGSAGSFFKNPVISRYYYEQEVKHLCPEMKVYEAGDGMIKLQAAWLIDHAGLKGYRCGGAKVYEKQPLVIVNEDNATGGDVARLADEIVRKVRHDFCVALSPEVNYIDTDIEVTVLGSGTSKGIPEIGCECDVCRSQDSHDKRLRASVLVRTHGMNLLIDASPDLRQQTLEHQINRVDAVLVTHSHYDHVGGIDDLRPLGIDHNIPIYLRKDVNSDLHRRLDYCFKEHPYPGVPHFDMHEIDNTPFYINGVKIMPVSVMHGKLPIVGYRIGDFAYITDAKSITEEEIEKLEGVRILIVNALRIRPHFAHFSLEEALDFIRKVNPQKAYLTHICHDFGKHADIEKMLPENVLPAYDGIKIHISGE